ncbi:agamous-like MADS-box protein TM6 isoform X2 [Syzygium oleosum]|uniref:agamous-like MADS-box protein TM6 isoform X2 n=1 Tax=Syzygium oleosum TaxID=219896 RepID=UPI0024B9DFFA|nr:agamous-like MADS-box protein TM6 isoform X2 [Syzygium oleosum]
MGRGKIEIQKIENDTNRQVTYSKRRNGIFKKAHELTVLCDARVSILMLSGNKKLHEYISPTTTTKRMIDDYQKALGVDLWTTHYDRMQEELRKLKEVNSNLRKEIRQILGHELNDLSFTELYSLEQTIESSVQSVRQRKVKALEQRYGGLLLESGATYEDLQYGLGEDIEGDYESAITNLANHNGASAMYALRLHPSDHDLSSEGHFLPDLSLN